MRNCSDDCDIPSYELFRKDQNLVDTKLPELTGEEAPAIFGHNKPQDSSQ
jgi:hypothetical protein